MIIGTAINPFEQCACPSDCYLCAQGVSHVSVRIKKDLAVGLNLDAERTNPKSDCGIGTHLREGFGIISEWFGSAPAPTKETA